MTVISRVIHTLPGLRRREGEPPPALLDRAGNILHWGPELWPVWQRTAAETIGLALGQILVPLDQPSLPELASLLPNRGWQSIVAVVRCNTGPPSVARAEISHTGDRLELRLEPLHALRADADAAPAPREAQLLRAVLENVPGFCYTIDHDFVFTSSEGAGLRLLNLTPGEVVGTNLLDWWTTRALTYEPLICHLKALAGIACSYHDVCLGRSIEYALRPLTDDRGSIIGAIGVGIDVTDRERSREERAKLVAHLRQSQKMEAVGRLAGGVAHVFNNYLTCIMGNLSLLEDMLKPGPEAPQYLAEANSAVDSAANLTRQLLAFSRKQVISPRALSLSALVERIAGILERMIGGRIRLSTVCPTDLWHVKADPSQLEQVLVNLVVNARDAISGQGDIVIETRNVDVSALASRAPEALTGPYYVALSVRDSGRGLSDVVRARLFEPFFTTKDAGAGTGLGLATVFGAVQENGGIISVDSELGRGSTFHVYLPRVEPGPSQGPSVLPSSPPSSTLVGGTETILLVEDEPSVLELANCTLQQLGYNVLPCAGSDEALHTFATYQTRIQLLLTDVVMPRMNGRDLASRICALSPGISVLFSSGYGENILARQAFAHNGSSFISKPYRPRELAAKVRELLDQRRH